MTSANTGSEIIGAIYEAALGEQGWEPALELIRSSAGASQTCMIISDNRAAQPIVKIAASDDPRWSAHLAQLYNDEFYRNDPTCDAVGRLRVGNWYQDTEGLTSAQREASRFHQEFLRPNGLSTWSSLLIQQDSMMTLLSIQWEGQRAMAPDSLQNIEGLLPHFQRGIRFHENFAAERARFSFAEAAIDGISTPMFLLGEAGRVLLTNKAAEKLMETETAFKVVKGFVVPPADQISLLHNNAHAGRFRSILGENLISTIRTMMKYLRLLPISVATTLAVFGVDTAQATPGSSAISCGSPAQAAGGTANGLISADTATTDGMRIYQNNAPFNLSFTTNSPGADTVVWSIADANGAIKTQGSFTVKSGVQTSTMACKSTWSGYGALTAALQSHGGTLPNMGTRPMGIATFGVLPNLSSVLGTVTYAHHDQHRFGMQGFNGNIAALHDLGISWTIDDREVSAMEPNGPNTYTPSVSDLDPFYKANPDQMRIVRLDGLPAWDSKTGQFNDSYYAPSNMPEFQSYMAKVGTDTSLIRAANYPNQQKNYYQVTWEPSLGWADSPENFVAMYKAAYQGLHSTDPNAVVMGPGNPFPANCDTCTSGYLKTFGALGLWNYIDAVSTHGYWNAGTFPAHPPELQDSDPDPANQANALDNQLIQLRSVMQAGKPNMKLFVTEAGASYDPGMTYGPTVPSQNQLFAHAAVGVRAHIITLGGGAQVSTLFYGADYPGEPGYGTFFDLNDAQGAWGASNLSPKPEALAFATMTRALDGTNTLGRVTGAPAGTFAYAFQQLGNGKIVTATWTHSNAQWPASGGLYSQTYSTSYSLQVDAAGASGNVTKIDGYGNVSTLPYTNGKVTLTLTEVPQYIVSSNATVAKANATVPVGYTGQ